jgi:hypothetical protein
MCQVDQELSTFVFSWVIEQFYYLMGQLSRTHAMLPRQVYDRKI